MEKNIMKIITMLLFFALFVLSYNVLYANKFGDVFSNIKLIEVPVEIKCFFGENGCMEGDIDMWTFIYAVFYFLIGYFIPNYYFTIFIISLLIEICQPLLRNNPKLIINPLIFLSAYFVGSNVSYRNNAYKTSKDYIDYKNYNRYSNI
jgi:hypothetical protein